MHISLMGLLSTPIQWHWTNEFPGTADVYGLYWKPLTSPSRTSCHDALEAIWERQRLRGHVPPTREEVDAYLQA